MDVINYLKLNKVDDKEKYPFDDSNRYAALEDLDPEMEINTAAWEMIGENIKNSAKERHKPWFDDGCSDLVDQRKQAKFQLLQYPSEIQSAIHTFRKRYCHLVKN
jgi:hypothetical protein